MDDDEVDRLHKLLNRCYECVSDGQRMAALTYAEEVVRLLGGRVVKDPRELQATET